MITGAAREHSVQYLNGVDYSVIAVYFAMLIGMGLYLQRRASASLNDYFLAGKRMPWWALGASGMASNLDITGTMLIISFLYMLGPRGLFIEFRGGAVLILPVMLLWTGKWNRRSECMTGAEWMNYRFGDRAGGHFARVTASLAVLVGTVGGLAYLTKGVGLFLSMFTDYSPMTCAAAMLAVASIYTMASGFYGVVYTDLVQSVIIFCAVVAIVIMACSAMNESPTDLATAAHAVTGSAEWTTSVPHWETTVPKGEEYAPYRYLFMYAFFALLKNIALGMSMGADPKYFGARNERECGTLTFLWTSLLMFRWPMMMGVAILGVFLVRDKFPDQDELRSVEMDIKRAFLASDATEADIDWDTFARLESVVPRNLWKTELTAAMSGNPAQAELVAALTATFGTDWQAIAANVLAQRELINARLPRHLWDERIAEFSKHPDQFPQLAASLEKVLGAEWPTKVKLVSYDGAVNPERILPAVLLFDIPVGLRGLVLVALLAASMSTFDSNLNGAAAYFTRDIYQRYLRPDAHNRELMFATYFFIVVMVLGGFWMGYSTTSINDIWSWLMMGLGAGLLVPGMLKFYWWRFNATGLVVGTFFGITGAVLDRLYPSINQSMQAYFPPTFPPELVGFVYLTGVGLVGAILGTFVGRPNDPAVLENFYRTTRPFGIWGPLKRRLSPEARAATEREHKYDLAALPFAVGWHITLFLIPMQLLVRNFSAAAITAGAFLLCLLGMYQFWYRQLPPASAGVLNQLDENSQPVLPARHKQSP